MREKLADLWRQRIRFRGTFKKYSLKPAYKGLPLETFLLLNVSLVSGEMVTDHLWMNLTKGFRELGSIYPGDIVAFDARVDYYYKGYEGEDMPQELDYKLSRPTKVTLLKRSETRNSDIYAVCPECGYHNLHGDDKCSRCHEDLQVRISAQEDECIPEYTAPESKLYQQQTLFPEQEDD